MSDLKIYKVTIHEHKIYDSYITAGSQQEAEEIAEDQVMQEDNAKWELDHNAGWIDIGDIEEVDSVSEEDYA